MSDAKPNARGLITPKKLCLIVGVGFGLIVLSCCSLWTVAIGPPIPWSKRFFRPIDPVSVWDRDSSVERLASQASACGLAWSAIIRGTSESGYESGPEYNFHLCPVSFDQRRIGSWEIKSVRVLVPGRSDALLLSANGPGPSVGDSSDHPLMESVRTSPASLVPLGDLGSVLPGDTIEVIAQVEVHFESGEPTCISEVRIGFDCVREWGLLRVYR